jgi:hypothetical protein
MKNSRSDEEVTSSLHVLGPCYLKLVRSTVYSLFCVVRYFPPSSHMLHWGYIYRSPLASPCPGRSGEVRGILGLNIGFEDMTRSEEK